MPCASFLASLYFLLSGPAVTEPTRFCLPFPLFPPKSVPYPTSLLQFLWSFLGFYASFPPSPTLYLASRPWALVLRMIRPSYCGVGSCGCGCKVLVGVARLLASSDPPLLSPYKFSGYLSSPPPFIFSSLFSLMSLSRSRSCPYPRAHPRTCIFSRPHPRPRPRPRPDPCPCSRHRFLPPIPGVLFSPQYHIYGQASELVPEAGGFLMVPPPAFE